MNLRPTPVVDAAEHRRKDGAPLGRVVHADTAREIERSRDELAEVLRDLDRFTFIQRWSAKGLDDEAHAMRERVLKALALK